MHEERMEQVVAEENLERALGAVIRNRGAAGIDRMTVHELEPHFRRHGDKIRAKLLAGKWTPSPVRRVEIPKPNGGKRPLGIPTVMDRLIQQALLHEPEIVPEAETAAVGGRARQILGPAGQSPACGQDARGPRGIATHS